MKIIAGFIQNVSNGYSDHIFVKIANFTQNYFDHEWIKV